MSEARTICHFGIGPALRILRFGRVFSLPVQVDASIERSPFASRFFMNVVPSPLTNVLVPCVANDRNGSKAVIRPMAGMGGKRPLKLPLNRPLSPRGFLRRLLQILGKGRRKPHGSHHSAFPSSCRCPLPSCRDTHKSLRERRHLL